MGTIDLLKNSGLVITDRIVCLFGGSGSGIYSRTGVCVAEKPPSHPSHSYLQVGMYKPDCGAERL